MSKISMAELGRAAVRAIETAVDRHSYSHYVNKTPKYVSIKVEAEHLDTKQLEQVADELSQLYPDRFLKVYNSTANPSMFRDGRSISWKEPKVNVRFTQYDD